MVAIYDIEEFDENPKTLVDWVRNFRLKKIQMKRKFRSGNLRVCAILSTALMSAEFELQRKQQERFQKWLEFQTKINKNHELQPRSKSRHHMQRQQQSNGLVSHYQIHEEENSKQSEDIANLWKCELSDLDNFMRSMSSSSNNHQSNNDTTTEHGNNYQKSVQNHSIRVSS